MKHTLAAACEGSEWIDADTPASACTVAGRGGEQLSLVFSDEFELEGRRFGDGRDSRWTAVETLPYTNKQLNVYNPHLPVTTNGFLQLPVTRRLRSAPQPAWQEGRQFESAMLQTWNKFCYTGGRAEISARLPGPGSRPGLWPAFWLLGNLARATYESSSAGVWPFSFDDCVRPEDEIACRGSQCHAQRISACNENPGHGMNPRQGRGAPEVDIMEGMAGTTADEYACGGTPRLTRRLRIPRPKVKHTLVVAPGFPSGSAQRPRELSAPARTCMANQTGGEWYPYELDLAGPDFHYLGASPPPTNQFSVIPSWDYNGGEMTDYFNGEKLQIDSIGVPNSTNWRSGGSLT